MRGRSCTVVMYHYVRDVNATDYPDIKALSVSDFERQLDWLEETHRILDYETFSELLARDRVSEDSPTALLTFDDGFVDHYETVFAILKARGLTGVFFVNDPVIEGRSRMQNVHKIHFLLAELGPASFAGLVRDELESMSEEAFEDHGMREDLYRYDDRDDAGVKNLLNYELPYEITDELLEHLFTRYIGNEDEFARSLYLSQAMLEEMATGGMTFGGHTKNHRVLSHLSRDGQRGELERGVELVRGMTDQDRVPFCYPYGHNHTYDTDTMELLNFLGYDTAFNTVRRASRPSSAERYEIPRYDTKDVWPFVAAEAVLP